MLLKWMALGFWKYFTSFWTILDFIIVFVSKSLLLVGSNFLCFKIFYLKLFRIFNEFPLAFGIDNKGGALDINN